MTLVWRANARFVRRSRAPLPLTVLAVAVAAVFASPVVFVAWRAATLDSDLGNVIGESVGPAWRTIQLALIVSIASGGLGTSLAWLITRTDVPGARMWRVLAPLPLVFPSFVGAAAFIASLGPDGVLRDALQIVSYHPPRRFRGLGASVLVLTAFTYPYVYLPVAARLATLPPQIEESCRLLGDHAVRSFVRVVMPMIRGSIGGGMLIVFLYCLSEFGAIQLLGFDTLTRVVYASRLADRAVSFAAATILVVMAIAAITAERRLRGSLGNRAVVAGRRNRPIRLGRWRAPAFAFVVAVLATALVVPVTALAQWAWRVIAESDDRWAALGHELERLGEPAWTTAWLSVIAAALAVAAVIPVAVLSTWFRSRAAATLTGAVLAGFAVPGVVIALSLAFWALNVPGFLRFYQTVPLLLLAYVVHFGSQALRSAETSVAAVPRRLDESALLLGASPLRRAATVHLPLMLPGLLAGGGLVLLSTLKELPTTLLLAPIGYTTLTTKVWGSFTDGFLAEAGFGSIALVAASAVLTWALILRRVSHL